MEEYNFTTLGDVPASTLGPTLPPLPKSVHQPVTIVVGLLCFLIMLVLLSQLGRVWTQGHRKISYFNASLSFSFLWALLRTILLFSYANHRNVASDISKFGYQVLFVLPVFFQFATLSVVVLYFCTVATRSLSVRLQRNYRWVFISLCILANIVFVTVNVWAAIVLSSRYKSDDESTQMKIRVSVTEVFTMFALLFQVIAALKIRKMVTSRTIIENRGVTVREMLIFTGLLVPLWLSRFVYNMVAIGEVGVSMWGYRWTFLTDDEDRKGDGTYAFMFFVMALFLWELLPVTLITWFFWVPRKQTAFARTPQSPKIVSFDEDDEDVEGEDESFDGGFPQGYEFSGPINATEKTPLVET